MKRTRISALSVKAAVLGVVALLGLALGGCAKQDPPASLYDPTVQDGLQPVISSVVPAAKALANVTLITITGQHFSPVKENNIVYFDASPGTVVSASATQLTVIPPNLVKDTVRLKIAVRGSQLFTNPPVTYKLEAAAASFGKLKSYEEPFGITTDALGNIYVSLTANAVGFGVAKFAPDGTRTDNYSPVLAGVAKWSALKMGPGGVIYAARILRAIYKIPAGGGPAAVWVSTSSGIGTAYDFDFDQNNNLWVGGNNAALYRLTNATPPNVKAFSFTANVRSVRVYNGYLYAGGKADTVEGVWRFRIVSPDSLGPVEEYYRFNTYAPGSLVNAITFNTDGDMYLGSDAPEGITIVHPNKSAEPLYAGVISPTSLVWAWGSGSSLYVSRSGKTPGLFLVNTLKTSAPYYGRP